MTTNPDPEGLAPVRPAAPAPRAARRGRVVRSAALVAAGAIGATAVTGWAFATTNSSPGSVATAVEGQAASLEGYGGYGGYPQGPMGMMGGGGGGGRGDAWRMPGALGQNLLHGDVVIKDLKGVVRTVRVQGGAVVGATATALVVASDDGYRGTYVLTSATKVFRGRSTADGSGLKAGDRVMVMAGLSGSTATAEFVVARPASAAAPSATATRGSRA